MRLSSTAPLLKREATTPSALICWLTRLLPNSSSRVRASSAFRRNQRPSPPVDSFDDDQKKVMFKARHFDSISSLVMNHYLTPQVEPATYGRFDSEIIIDGPNGAPAQGLAEFQTIICAGSGIGTYNHSTTCMHY